MAQGCPQPSGAHPKASRTVRRERVRLSGGWLGEGRLAPTRALALEAPGREAEVGRGRPLDAEGLEEMLRVLSEGLGEEVAGAEPGELAPGLRVGLARRKRCVTPREEVELDAPALGQQLAGLGAVALAAALLVCAAGIAAVGPALPVALAGGRGACGRAWAGIGCPPSSPRRRPSPRRSRARPPVCFATLIFRFGAAVENLGRKGTGRTPPCSAWSRGRRPSRPSSGSATAMQTR